MKKYEAIEKVKRIVKGNIIIIEDDHPCAISNITTMNPKDFDWQKFNIIDLSTSGFRDEMEIDSLDATYDGRDLSDNEIEWLLDVFHDNFMEIADQNYSGTDFSDYVDMER